MKLGKRGELPAAVGEDAKEEWRGTRLGDSSGVEQRGRVWEWW